MPHPKLDQIRELRARGLYFAQIGEIVGCSESWAHRIYYGKTNVKYKRKPGKFRHGKPEEIFPHFDRGVLQKVIAFDTGFSRSTISRWHTKWKRQNGKQA